MIEFAESPVVLSAARSGSDLILRIDSNLWNTDLGRTDAVRVITVHDAQLTEAEDPAAWVGHHIQINEYSEGETHFVELTINFAVDYIEVTCRATSQAQGSYSPWDLTAKLAAIIDVAKQYASAAELAERELQRVRQEIGARLRRELDVGERKRQFFANSQPQRAQALEAELRFLRELNDRLEPRAAT